VKIAIVSWESLAGPAWTEAAVLASRSAETLAACGADVHLFTARGPQQPAEAMVGAVPCHRCAHDPSPDPREEVESFGRAVLDRLGEEERQETFDFVHGFEWPAAAVLGELRREGRRATAWSLLRFDEEWLPPKWLRDDPEVELRPRYHPEEFADRVLVPSDQAREWFLERWTVPPERVEVIHPGIDPLWLGETVDPAAVKAGLGFDVYDPVVLCIGPLTPAARPDLVLDAMPQVLERHQAAKLVFAGAGELAGYLRERALVLGVEGAARLPGEVCARELAQLCQACDVVCLPQRSRHLLAPYLESWSAGKPVVITGSHAAADFVWHEVTGYVVEDSCEGIARGILWLFEDFARCRWIGENGRRAVESAFGWPAIGGQLLDCYERTTAERALSARPD